jgi:glycogen synthase
MLFLEGSPKTRSTLQMGSYLFNPHNLKPTRITHHSATLTDNIFFNSVSHHTVTGNIVYNLTDHLPNFLIINKFTTLQKALNYVKEIIPILMNNISFKICNL